MEALNPTFILFLFFFSLFSVGFIRMSHSQLLPIVEDQAGGSNRIQTYIVYVAKPEAKRFLGHEDLKNWHLSFLPNATLDSGFPRLVYSYRDAISGFAARLTAEEVKAMEVIDGFVFAKPEERRELLTTYTPQFLGLNTWDGAWSKTLLGEGIIIGVLDTGILPTHPSFNDNKMPPAPLKWNGTCFPGFACNNKILGAKCFYSKSLNPSSPIDTNGHGTHVASTAAGSFVNDASVLGMAKGVASGMAPKAHLAIYKVCNVDGCWDADILAGIDQAISDRVDIISMSISGDPDSKLYEDSVAAGSLAAFDKGISAVAAAGNAGPGEKTLNHEAPWVLTVGASSTDRRVGAFVTLGSGEILQGESAFQPTNFNGSKQLPLAYPGINGNKDALYCKDGSLDYIDVRGMAVLCWEGLIDDIEKGKVVDAAGGAAMILMNLPQQGYTTSPTPHVLPVSHLSHIDGVKARDYYYSSKSKGSTPTAAIQFNGTRFGFRPSPGIASFSSRGPSRNNVGVLKPDVLAPGVNILAAWPVDVGPNPSWFATKTFNFESGTSMATPHVSGIIALLMNKYPLWSPAAYQSAIITTAVDRDLDGNIIVDENSNKTAGIHTRGAGQVNPKAAMDPGLIYDLKISDHIAYLCGLGFTNAQVTAMVGRTIRCAQVKAITAAQLNYPSISAFLGGRSMSKSFERTVTNVGESNSVYLARITEPTGVTVDLSSYRLQFSRLGQEISFTVKLTLKPSGQGLLTSAGGKLEWVSKKHVVASPIAVTFF